MSLLDPEAEKNKETPQPEWTDYDETMLEKSIKELEKWKFAEHEKVIKKIRKQY
ncbi:MAG: hypothetical protein NXI23_17215 [Bacteroidetes bacterium]|jgi:hypothetical protein|nr:hypothetical protein [Bacteroidota bacterium]MDF1866325.1 hypothetical protein [Saprospiraceae bacterium]